MTLTLDIALSMQKGLQSKLDVTTNNIAQQANHGFKERQVIFSEFVGNGDKQGNYSYANDIATVRNLLNGAIEKTGHPFHFALQSRGYFGIQTPEGIRYTRSGAFTMNADNVLVDHKGNTVLSIDGGDIAIPPESRDLNIAPDGTITDENGVIARIGVFEFQNEQAMFERGDNYLQTDQEAEIVDADASMIQGALELSNGNPVKNIASLTETTRLYSVNQRIIEEQFKLSSKQIDQLTTLPPAA